MTSSITRISTALAALIALAACGTRNVPGSSSGPGKAQAPPDAGPAAPPMHKVAIIELQIDGGQIWMSITNEVGATDLVDVGTFDGACTDDVDATGDPDIVKAAVFAVDCVAQGAGVRLRFVRRGLRLIVMRAAAGSDDFAVSRSLELPDNARLSFEK